MYLFIFIFTYISLYKHIYMYIHTYIYIAIVIDTSITLLIPGTWHGHSGLINTSNGAIPWSVQQHMQNPLACVSCNCMGCDSSWLYLEKMVHIKTCVNCGTPWLDSLLAMGLQHRRSADA